MRRRQHLALPFEDEIPLLAELVAGGTVAPSTTRRFSDAVLYHNLAGYGVAAIDTGRLSLPEEDRRRIADAHARRALHAGLLRRELAAIEPVLAEAGDVRPLVVKGPALADRYYPDPLLRPFADIDVLVPRDRLELSVLALLERGFAVLEEFRPGYAATHGHDVHLRRTLGRHRLDVELHWRIGDDPVGIPLDHARLAATATPFEAGDAEVLGPAGPEQLIVLAVHLLSDRQKRFDWIDDIALVAASATRTEWDRTFELAQGLGLLWVLHRALDYAERHLGFERERPLAAGPPPPWGPLRAVEELDARAAPHFGRLAALGWRERASYLQAVLVPTRQGLEGTVGGDGASTATLLARHTGRVLASIVPRREG